MFLDLASLSFRRTVSMRLAGDTSAVRFSGDGDAGGAGRHLMSAAEPVDVEEEAPHIRASVIATLMLFLVTSLFTGKNVFLDFMEGVGGNDGDTGAETGGGGVADGVALSMTVSSSMPTESRLSSPPPLRDGEASSISLSLFRAS